MSKFLYAALLGAALAPHAHAQTLGAASAAGEIIVTGAAPDIAARPVGQTLTGTDRDAFANAPAFQIGDVLAGQPGVTYAYGNGPRDISLSVRGSNARNTFGVRNVQVLEDGFAMTQPDGLARTDLVDPHAYAAIDVAHGPSSALYGNYATGGAILFRTRTGADIAGVEVGADGGSFGYANLFAAAGGAGETYDAAGFLSYVRGDGFTQHTAYNTTTQNARAAFTLSPRDRVIVKFINNDMRADLSIRLSLNQFRINPHQDGCATLAGASCASVSVLANGFNGARVSLSADQAGLKRDDRRTIAGARWEHDVDTRTLWRSQLVWDNRDITQPTSATGAVGTFPSYNFVTDVTRHGARAVLFAGAFANYEDVNSNSYNVMPGGNATLGGLATATLGSHLNAGARARAELTFDPRWSAVFGAGIEHTRLKATQTAYSYPTTGAPTTAQVRADRTFFNVAPEASLIFKPDANWRLHARAAGAYGTPQATNLFVTPAGTPGNNTTLDAQRMAGIDVGAAFTPSDRLSLSLTGFYEFFEDELVSQSAGANLLNYTFNAPRSEHRGLEAALDWRPKTLDGLKATLSYFLNDQIYTDYAERLSAGAFSTAFDRAGNAIPGVPRQTFFARVGYDAKGGPLAGIGAYVEANWRESAYLDNANLLRAPGYTLVNLNLHYDPPEGAGALARARFYLSAQNVTDEAYVSSASNIANSLSATTGLQNGAGVLAAATGSIYAGQPRTIIAGISYKF